MALETILRSRTKVSDLVAVELWSMLSSIDGCTDLHIIQSGALTGRRYRDEILRSIVVPYALAIGDNFILMDDNFIPHRANLVNDFFLEKGIIQME